MHYESDHGFFVARVRLRYEKGKGRQSDVVDDWLASHI